MAGELRRADRFQRRHGWLGFPAAVAVKFVEDQAGRLSALIAYYAFLSVFPLLLVLTTILGFVLAGNPELVDRVMSSALGEFPIISRKNTPTPLTGSPFALTVGLILAMWSGTAAARTMQTAANSIYSVAHINRPGLFPRLARSIELVAVAGMGLAATTLLHGVIGGTSAYGVHVAGVYVVLTAILGTAVNFLLFSYLFRRVTVLRLRTRHVLPGAALAAVAWFVLQKLGAELVNTKIRGAEGTYGVFAVVIGLLFWFFVLAQVTMLCMEINVVATQRLWPRSFGSLCGLATTDADVRAHMRYIDRGQRARNLTVLTQVTPMSAAPGEPTSDHPGTPSPDK